LFEQLGELIYVYGPLGVFLVSFLGNVIPYSTIPYLIFVVQYGVAIGNPLIRIGIAVLGGLGAALGKVIVLLIGFATRKVIPEKTKKSMKLFMTFRRYYKANCWRIICFSSYSISHSNYCASPSIS